VWTQKDANMWFEGPPFDIAAQYARKMNFVMVSIFFMPMFPLALPAGILALFTNRLIQKYLLFRRHAAPNATGEKLNYAMYRFFDIVIIIYSVSCKIEFWKFNQIFRSHK
jgi:hypothetical protein